MNKIYFLGLRITPETVLSYPARRSVKFGLTPSSASFFAQPLSEVYLPIIIVFQGLVRGSLRSASHVLSHHALIAIPVLIKISLLGSFFQR